MRPRQFQWFETDFHALEAPAWVKDPIGRYLAVSQGLAGHLSTRRQDMVGRSQADFWPDTDVKRFEVDDRAALAREKAVAAPERHPTMGFIVTLKLPIYGPGGRPVATLGVFTRQPPLGWQRVIKALAARLEATCRPHFRQMGLRHPPSYLAVPSLVRPTLNDPSVPPWLAGIRQELTSHFRRPHRIQALAHGAGVHPNHVGRAFRRTFGYSIHDYLAQLRVDWCRMELLQTERPAREIGIEAGFADQSHFIRVFRSETGTTPGIYRTASRQQRPDR